MPVTIEKSISKKEAALKLKVCSRTLAKWLNERYFKDLVKLGYRKTDILLNPRVQNYLFNKLDFK